MLGSTYMWCAWLGRMHIELVGTSCNDTHNTLHKNLLVYHLVRACACLRSSNVS